MKPWAFVPLDDRPCCLDFPARLAPVLLPPVELLGRFQQPGRGAELVEWLAIQDVAGAVVSLDMVAWGVLVASRHPASDLQQALRQGFGAGEGSGGEHGLRGRVGHVRQGAKFRLGHGVDVLQPQRLAHLPARPGSNQQDQRDRNQAHPDKTSIREHQRSSGEARRVAG